MNGFTRKPLIPGVLVLTAALGFWLPACSAQDKPAKDTKKGTILDARVVGKGQPEATAAGVSGEVLAVVNGKEVTQADVQKSAEEQFKALEREYQQNKHQLTENTLETVVRERLLEAEAAARKVSKEQLLTEIKAAPVTDADVEAFYNQNKERIPRPMADVAAQIKQYLEQQNQQKAQTDFYGKLQDKYSVEYKMEPIRVEVAANGPSKGPENAPVTIVEFSDFQCPFCSRVNPTLAQVREKYGDKVRIVFRQFPLSFHQQAQKAAEASLCAHEQGKFWEMHDAMFANQQALGVDQLKSQATQLGLNGDAFNSCLDSSKYAAQVAQDLKEGSAAGVSGTPAMFVNGRFISGAVPFEQIAPVIEDELKRKGIKTAATTSK